jgi:hypothetical protein
MSNFYMNPEFPSHEARGEKPSEIRKENPSESLWRNVESKKLFAEFADRAISEKHLEKAGSLFFLDRSARPVAWYINERLKVLFPGQPLPEIKFINIGRNNSHDLRYTEDGDEAIEKMRELYGAHIPKGDIVAIDEYVATGGTIEAAIHALSVAFPDHIVRGIGIVESGENRDIDDRQLFPWLRDDAAKGIVEADWESIASGPIRRSNYKDVNMGLKQRSFEEVHEVANKLRQEMKELAHRPAAE